MVQSTPLRFLDSHSKLPSNRSRSRPGVLLQISVDTGAVRSSSPDSRGDRASACNPRDASRPVAHMLTKTALSPGDFAPFIARPPPCARHSPDRSREPWPAARRSRCCARGQPSWRARKSRACSPTTRPTRWPPASSMLYSDPAEQDSIIIHDHSIVLLGAHSARTHCASSPQ